MNEKLLRIQCVDGTLVINGFDEEVKIGYTGDVDFTPLTSKLYDSIEHETLLKLTKDSVPFDSEGNTKVALIIKIVEEMITVYNGVIKEPLYAEQSPVGL